MERTASDASDTTTYRDAGQAAASIKRIAADAGDGVGDGEGAGFSTRALNEGSLQFVIKDTIGATIIRVGCIHRNRSQATATTKHPASDAGDATTYRDASETGATLERTASDTSDGVGNGDTAKAGTAIESCLIDGGNAGRYGDAGKAAAAIKRIVTDGGDAVGDDNGSSFTFWALDDGGL